MARIAMMATWVSSVSGYDGSVGATAAAATRAPTPITIGRRLTRVRRGRWA